MEGFAQTNSGLKKEDALVLAADVNESTLRERWLPEAYADDADETPKGGLVVLAESVLKNAEHNFWDDTVKVSTLGDRLLL